MTRRIRLQSNLCAIVILLMPLLALSDDVEDFGPISNSPTNQQRPGKLVWMDLLTADVVKAANFYERVFAWEFELNEDRSYAYGRLNGAPVAAIALYEDDDTIPNKGLWLTSIAVNDVDAAVDRVVIQGGEVVDGPAELPGRGRYSLVTDNRGAAVMLLRAQGGDPEESVSVSNSWAWVELWTDDVTASVQFYEQVLGYRSLIVKGSTGSPVYILGRDQQPRASILASPFKDVETNWLPYLLVDDVKATIHKVAQNGGTILLPPQQDGLNHDVAIVSDPTGGVFALQEARRK
jgi:predicted enzyme related to lactoylglutathione lyase